MYPTKSAQLYPIRSPFNCAWLNWLNWKLSWYQRVVQCHSHLGHLVVTWGDNRGTRQGYWRPAQRSWLLKSKGIEVRIRVSKTYMQVVILRKGWSQICGRRAWIQVWEESGKCALVGEYGSKCGCNCGRMWEQAWMQLWENVSQFPAFQTEWHTSSLPINCAGLLQRLWEACCKLLVIRHRRNEPLLGGLVGIYVASNCEGSK